MAQQITTSAGQTNIRKGEAGPSGTHPKKRSLLTMEEIRLRAYRNWEAAGKPNGDCVRFWLAAEQELLQGRS